MFNVLFLASQETRTKP